MTALEAIIHEEIARQGPLPFTRFTELALYHPEYGYYERAADPVGRGGDFYTSVSVGPLFGELLAWRFTGWLESTGSEKLHLIEAGAHGGQLAADILGWLQAQRPELVQRLRYTIIEPSARQRQRQQRRLAEFGERVSWQSDWPLMHPADSGTTADGRRRDGAAKGMHDQVATPSLAGSTVVFSNELLDAFPVHRVGWDAREQRWFEWAVAAAGNGFAWHRLALAPALAAALPRWLLAGTVWGAADSSALRKTLPDGFTFELSPAAEAWWSRAAQTIARGWLLTFDYGFVAGEFLKPERTRGTLRAYRGHTVRDDLLASPGEQDLTAHVNFAVLQAAGEAVGLRTVECCPQERFLMRVAAELPPDWPAERTRQLRTLVHPGHLGRAFRVLVQQRG